MANSYKMTRLHSGDRKISSETWNGFVQLYEDSKNRTSISADPLNRPIPPILNGSSIALAVLKKGQSRIGGYSPVRITKVKASKDLAFALPLYEVEAVDAVDANGDATERHGNYAFTMAEGITKDGGGRIIIAGLAIVAVTREEAEGLTNLDDPYGNPFPAYEGNYDTAYYVVPDGTILDDDSPIRLAPVGHFAVTSWYDPSATVTGKKVSDSVFFVINLESRFTTQCMEVFAGIAGYQGAYNAQTLNFGYAYIEAGVVGDMADIDDNPRIGNNSFAGSATPANEPSILTGESVFRCKVTNPNIWDVSAGRTHMMAYDRSLNRLIVSNSQPHGDGRTAAWYYSFDPDEMVSRGRSSGFYMGNGWGNYDDDTTDSIPYPTYLYTSEDRFAEGTVMLAADYMTYGGNNSDTFKNQGVQSQYADEISCAIVLMLDENHEYATFCSEKCPEEGVLMSADYGEFRIIKKSPMHSASPSGTYPQWNRCHGFLKNQSQMSGTVETDGVNDTAHEGNRRNVVPQLTSEGLTEIEVATVKSNVLGLTRANHVDLMAQPQYQGSLTFIIRQAFTDSDTIELDSTTLYKFDYSTVLKVWGVEADGTETEIDNSTWQTSASALHDLSTSTFPTVYNVNFFWEEKYKYVYFDLDTEATAFHEPSGTISLHRRTNFGGDPTHSSGLVTQPADLTLPAWPTYPNGDVESAGVYYAYR